MIIVGCIIGVLLAIYVYLSWNFEYWTKRGVFSPKPKLLLGNLPNAVLRKESLVADFGKLYDKYKNEFPFIGIIQIRQPWLLILDPEVGKDVMIRNFKSFHDNEFGKLIDQKMDPLMGRNPFVLRGDEWKEKRSEITPAFTSNRLKAVYPLIVEVQKQMINYINREIKSPFDARELSAKFTTDVVSSCIYSADAQSFTKENPEIRAMGRKLMDPAGSFLFKMSLVEAFPFLGRLIKLQFVSKDVESFFVSLLNQALKYRDEHKIVREDFLDYLMMLKKKKNITDLDIAAHTISFFSDGFDTSSVAIAHTLYELGKNKNVQDKLRKEIRKCVDKNGEIGFEHLYEMSYLDQVFHESLRMHSPSITSSRECTEDFTLNGRNGEKVLVEKGTPVLIPTHQFHYDPEYYSEPNKFSPERFDPENGGLKLFKDKGVYLPFGDGPRICLGMKFALLQSKAAIVAVVENFEISVNAKTQEPLIIDPNEFLNYKVGGLWLDFKAVGE